MTSKISETGLAGLRRQVIAAAEAVAEWDRRTAGLRPVRLICRRTGEMTCESPMSRDDYEGPSVDRQGPDVDDRRLMGQDVSHIVYELHHILVAVDQHGHEMRLDLGDWLRRLSVEDAIGDYRRYLESEAAGARRTVEEWESRLADGRAAVSPTAAEERAETVRRERQSSLRAARRRLDAAQVALAALLREEATYRANGHDFDAMIDAARCDVVAARRNVFEGKR